MNFNSVMFGENLAVFISNSEFKGKTPFVGIIQIRTPRLVVIEPELVKDVLIRNFKNFPDNEFSDMIDKDSDPLLSRNPFFLKGEEWKEKRAEVTPAFTASRLKAIYPLIEDVQVRLINYINQQLTKNEPFESRELCAKFTTDVVSNSIFGIDAQSFTKEKPEIREMGRRLMAPAGSFIIKVFLVTALPIFKKFVNMRFIAEDIEKFFIDLMQQALKYREENNIQREDFLDYLIQLRRKKGLKDIEMAAHTISFFTDGFETSSIAIAHVLYEVMSIFESFAHLQLNLFFYLPQLGKNKQSQDKLRNEIKKHCDKNGKISFDSLNEMPYLDQVWHETLRMHPPAAFTSRLCTEPIVLDFEGQKAPIEAGMNIYVPIHQIHYDPEYYSEPEKFMPERFDPENGGLKTFKDKAVYLPFGDGPRICLGMKFANLQSKSAIVAVVRNFEISVNSKTAKNLIVDPTEFLNIKVGGLWLDLLPISL